MSRALTDGEVKALWTVLVRCAGGQEAAAVHLAVSRQRVQQLGSPNCPDMPTLRQVLTLEASCERSVITKAAVIAVEGEPTSEVTAAAVCAVSTAADALRAIHDMDADRQRTVAEIGDVRGHARRNLDAAERLVDATGHLSPGRLA